jgi:hypothetical protein
MKPNRIKPKDSESYSGGSNTVTATRRKSREDKVTRGKDKGKKTSVAAAAAVPNETVVKTATINPRV